MRNKTAVASRKVTRTVEVRKLSVTAVDMESKSLATLEIQIPAIKYRTNVALEKAIQNALSAINGKYKYVDHAELGSEFILYSMPESFYIANATIVATGTDKKALEKWPNEQSEAEQ